MLAAVGERRASASRSPAAASRSASRPPRLKSSSDCEHQLASSQARARARFGLVQRSQPALRDRDVKAGNHPLDHALGGVERALRIPEREEVLRRLLVHPLGDQQLTVGELQARDLGSAATP